MSFHDEFEEVGGVAGDDFDEVGGGGEGGDVEPWGAMRMQEGLTEWGDDLDFLDVAQGSAGAAVHHGDGTGGGIGCKLKVES